MLIAFDSNLVLSGKFSPGDGTSACMNCSAGSYAPSSGSQTCLVCAAGAYTTTGVSCLPCGLPTQYSAAGSTVCSLCRTGDSFLLFIEMLFMRLILVQQTSDHLWDTTVRLRLLSHLCPFQLGEPTVRLLHGITLHFLVVVGTRLTVTVE